MKKEFSEKFFYWALCLVLITLPMPKYSLNSQSLILLFIAWIFYNSVSEKAENLRNQRFSFLIISSVFWISVISGLLFSNTEVIFESLIQNLPFLIIPLIVFTTIKERKAIIKSLNIFSFSVIAAALLAFFKAIYFKYNNFGNFFYYSDFSKLLGVHTTYFALFIVISIVYFLYDIFELKEINKWISLFCLLFLLGVLYLVSSRISIVALLIVGIYFISIKGNLKKASQKILAGIFIATIFIVVMATPNFQNRSRITIMHKYNVPDLNTRILHWKAVINTIKSNNLLLGNGVDNARDMLIEQYETFNFESGHQNKYNAHNQFLENTLNFGLIGFLSLISVFGIIFYQSMILKNDLFFILTTVFFLFMLTESLLMRHHGIVCFVVFASLILNNLPYINGKSLCSSAN
jgi:O-antigen ligase